jgi:hypothetical protein
MACSRVNFTFTLLITEYYWGNQIKEAEWAGNVAHMRERLNTYRVLVRKPGGKRPFWRPGCRREYNINVDLKEMG